MELIVVDPTYDHEGRDPNEFLSALRRELSGVSKTFDCRDVDIGFAADWPAILAIFTGLFFLGKPINDNIEAWFSLAKKFKSMLKQIAQKFGHYRIDETGATLLGISIIASQENEDIADIQQISSNEIQFNNFPLKDPGHLDHHPDNLYVQVYLVNKARIYVFGIKSKGTVEFQHTFNTSWLDF